MKHFYMFESYEKVEIQEKTEKYAILILFSKQNLFSYFNKVNCTSYNLINKMLQFVIILESNRSSALVLYKQS